MAEPGSEGGIGAPRIALLALAAIALTGALMVLRFPYDRVAGSIARQIEMQTGSRIAFGSVGVSLVRFAPGLAASSVEVVSSDGTRLSLDRVGVRPALALSWLRGDPALAVEVESARGAGSGVATFGGTPGFSGGLRDVDLEQLPQQQIGAPLRLKGRVDADVDVVVREEGPEGSVEFEARDGLLTHPELPMPMPFSKLTGEIDLGGQHWAELKQFVLESPLASGHASGTIGKAPAFASAPLELALEFTVSSAVQGSLRAQGVAVGNDGAIRVAVSGTPMRPVVR
jgi:type II secretion system protein N